MASNWEIIAAEHRQSSFAKIPLEWLLPSSIRDSISQFSAQNVLDIPRSCGLLSTEEIDITENYDATTLIEHLASGKFTSLAVTTAFCKRAAIAQQLTSCLTEIFFDQALERAKYCDEYLAEEGKTLGPFHGLPISLKDSFKIKGLKSTIGFVSFISHPPSTTNSALVDILLSQGAVFYVKTNIPQTLMTADSHNNVFNRTLNPHHLNLTAGGSSGGEGALSAMRGSILGVGTDIAGSIRIPAFCNGCVGFKPSTQRIAYGGQQSPSRAGSFGIVACAGPICHSVKDAKYFMKNVLDFDCWTLDESVLSVPWRGVHVFGKERKLRLGMVDEDSRFPLLPPMARIYGEVQEKLASAGHTIVSLPLPDDSLSITGLLAFKFFSSDPTSVPFQHILASGEPIVPSIPTTMPPELKDYKPSLDAVFQNNIERTKIRGMWRDMWVKEGLDGIIMPVYQGVAPQHDKYGGPPYTVLANVLDYPSCAIPYGKAEKEKDEKFVKDVKYVPAYDPEGSEGVPGGIQVMGRNMRDEETLEVATIVEAVLKG